MGEHAKVAARILEGLHGDALDLAMDGGWDSISQEGGIPKFVERIRSFVFPSAKAEAKELYVTSQRVGGPLSRQNGESMISFISRRRRWAKMLHNLDPSIGMSDELRGDMLMDRSGLSETERLMVLTSTGNGIDLEKMAEALRANIRNAT